MNSSKITSYRSCLHVSIQKHIVVVKSLYRNSTKVIRFIVNHDGVILTIVLAKLPKIIIFVPNSILP